MQRTHFIIKPRIQITYMVISFFVVCLTALAVYYAFWSSLVRAPGMDQLSGGEIRALYHAYNLSFVWVVAILGAGVAFLSVFYFHRLVGPVFVTERVVKAMAQGDFTVSMHLRKHDELKELAQHVQEMLTNLRGAVREDRARVEAVKTLLEQGKIAQAKDALGEISRWYKLDEQPAAKE